MIVTALKAYNWMFEFVVSKTTSWFDERKFETYTANGSQ